MSTPFDDYKATQLSIEEILKIFVVPKHIGRMYKRNTAVITGQRGTGKTTLLRYIENKYNQSIDSKMIGVYLRFDINTLMGFAGDYATEDEWEKLFAHWLSTVLCMKLAKNLIQISKVRYISNESAICKRVANLINQDSTSPDNCSFEELFQILESVERRINRFKRNPRTSDYPQIGECEKALEEFCWMLHEYFNHEMCIHVLLDEYENLFDFQKTYINTCMKNASYYLTYKVCVRPGGFASETLKKSEVLGIIDDYEALDFEKDILGDERERRDFLVETCNIRLKMFFRSRNTKLHSDIDLSVEQYFKVLSFDDKAQIIEKKTKYVKSQTMYLSELFQKNGEQYTFHWDIIEIRLFRVLSLKRGFDFRETLDAFVKHNQKYMDWQHNYRVAVLYLCYAENKLTMPYGGFDSIFEVSGGITRYVLEICDYCFEVESNAILKSEVPIPISYRNQTMAINRTSERRYQHLCTIPEYGREIRQMILMLGRIFSLYHKDERLSSFEPNHFALSLDESEKSMEIVLEDRRELISAILAKCVMWGALTTSKSTKKKKNYSLVEDDIDYSLHPILTPYFQISARKKQKCVFSYSEIFSFLFDSNKDCEKALMNYSMKITGNPLSDNGISLLDSFNKE